MKKEVLFVLLNQYADWESAFLGSAISLGVKMESKETNFVVKTVSITKDPVVSMGGFNTLIDYDINSIPRDYSALILIGGIQWNTKETELLVPIIQDAMDRKIVIGAICAASIFLGVHGFLNDGKHTSNTLDLLKQFAGNKYTGENNYIEKQAVSCNNLVTANGSGYLEFTKEVLLLLEVDFPDTIEKYYQFNKHGFYQS